MGSDKRVTVHSRLTLVPAKPTAPGKLHFLSLLDHLMKLHFIRSVYYFTGSSFTNNRPTHLDELKESLCRTLNLYPSFAGRLRKREDGKWEVKCNDAGVRIYEANTELSFDDWPDSESCPVEKELATVEIIPDHTISPVAIVQFTDFKCGGLTIGFSWLHALGDPSCGTLFMKAWGEMHRGAQIMHPPFVHPPALEPRPVRSTDTKSVQYYASTFHSKSNENDATTETSADEFATVTFKFSQDSVERCISEVQKGEFHYGPTTPFEALSALLWVSIAKAQEVTSAQHSKLCLCLDFRKIHMAPLPHGFFGNAIHFVGVTSQVCDLTSRDISYAASLINESTSMIDTVEIRSVIDWLQEQENQGVGLCSNPGILYGSELTCCCWENFLCYDVIFTVEKPIHVAYYVQPLQRKGMLQVIPCADGNSGRNVIVTLPMEQMQKLCEDPSLLRFLPNAEQELNRGATDLSSHHVSVLGSS